MQQLNIETTTLGEMRQGGTVKQAVIAHELNVQEPAISKLERKRIKDAKLDKLQQYVKALGGTLTLAITLPDGTVLNMT